MTHSDEKRQLMAAAQALARKDLVAAERILARRLNADPDEIIALRLMAEVATRRGNLHEAEALLRAALRQDATFSAARFHLAAILYRQNRPDEAVAELDYLLALNPSDDAALKLKAAVTVRFGNANEALAIYEAMLAREPDQVSILLSYGHVLKEVGRQEESAAAYRRVTGKAPMRGEAWWSLANLKTEAFSAVDIDAMRTALALNGLSDTDRLHLHFALGKALEDAKLYRLSFSHYAEGNRIRRGMITYDPTAIAEFVNQAKRLFSADFFASRRDFGCPSKDPIFVLGMPRSGSTLVEQMLASHPLIEGTAELPDIPNLARELRLKAHKDNEHSVDWLAHLRPEDCMALGEEYLKRTRAYRKSDCPFFVDKLPNNWKHIGFIHLILPNAAIIDVRRNPLDCCFSNFKQHFASGQGFAYDQRELATYYMNYVRFLEHMDQSLPGRVRRLSYESLVIDPEFELRRLFDYLQITFAETCLHFHENDRAIKTASSQQVRQPLNRGGVHKWQPYESFLSPMKEILSPLLKDEPTTTHLSG